MAEKREITEENFIPKSGCGGSPGLPSVASELPICLGAVPRRQEKYLLSENGRILRREISLQLLTNTVHCILDSTHLFVLQVITQT